ncbi:hypothetical protein [Enterococcus sp. AZ126]|uniref:hypothetical protein n=1 Tax=Enterococcus sp. AZ126 TaxID=2774635 RepID=UPI003F287501
MVEENKIREMTLFIQKYSDFVSSESPSTIIFKEELFLCDIDTSIINSIPAIEGMVSTDFFINGEKYNDVHSVSDLKEQTSDTYRMKKDSLEIITKINKKLYFSNTEQSNCYLFLNLENFFYVMKRLDWVCKKHKMNIFLLLGTGPRFESPFLNICPYKDKDGITYEKIDEFIIDQYKKFNKIYSAIYDDVKLKDFWEYPITWKNDLYNEGYDRVSEELLSTFVRIVCNKNLKSRKYIIRGHKTIIMEITPFSISKDKQKLIGELFDFILDADKHQDKLQILRNTMTIYLDTNSDTKIFVEKIEEILKSVNFSFNLYIQDEIELFLGQKNKLLQEFISTARKVEDLTNTLITQFRTVILSLLGTIFLSLLNNINSSKTSAILNLVFLSYIIYFIVNFILIFYQKKQKEALLVSLKNYTEELGVIGDAKDNNLSYDGLKEKYVDESLSIYDKYRIMMLIGLVVLIIAFSLLYMINRFSFFPDIKTVIKNVIGY